MIINNVNKKSFVQESELDNKSDINKIEEEKKPEIELTNIGEENDEDFSKLIENTKNMDLGIKIETKKCKINIKKLLIELVFFILNSISFLFYYLSLEGCFLKQTECIPLLSTMFLGKIAIFGILAAIMTCVQI